MSEEIDEVMHDAITARDLPWTASKVIHAGFRLGVLRNNLWDTARDAVGYGVVRHPWEVALLTSRNNAYVFIGFTREQDAVALCEALTDMEGNDLAEAFWTMDLQDTGSRSEALLAQWREICFAWSWENVVPGDIATLDHQVEADTIDGPAIVEPGYPFEVLDVPLETRRSVLAKTSDGVMLTLPLEAITVIAQRPDEVGRERDAEYVYRPGVGYIVTEGGTR